MRDSLPDPHMPPTHPVLAKPPAFIAGPAGLLSLAYHAPAAAAPTQPIVAIVAHPHPLYGGSMDNKVVTTLARTFSGMGVHAVRFNFRGVGHSSGQFDNAVGETADLLAVVDWVQATFPGFRIFLAGFSFGGYVCLRALSAVEPKLALVVSPAVTRFDPAAIPPFNTPWIVAQGEQDTTVPADGVRAFVHAYCPHNLPHWLAFPHADHFFHGQLMDLRAQIEGALTSYLIPESVSSPAT